MRRSRLVRTAESAVAMFRTTLTRSTRSLFAHAPYPLERTLEYRGDEGLLGPDSISWEVIADPAAFVGGLRSLLIQAAHPEVVAGVDQHSRYQDDPLGRLSRTSAYVTATTFGAMPEVETAVAQVRRIHRVVNGISSRGLRYDAADPGHSAWVHNVLTDSFLVANQVFGGRRLDPDGADGFVSEQTRIGALLGADPMPQTADELSHWVEEHPALAPSPEMEKIVDFLSDPPISIGIKAGYRLLLEGAIAVIPIRIRRILGVEAKPGGEMVGRAAVASLRWATGYSPSWALALTRSGAEVPWDRFREPPLERAS
jgi:uncharacterized protein (DUF2236 family)